MIVLESATLGIEARTHAIEVAVGQRVDLRQCPALFQCRDKRVAIGRRERVEFERLPDQVPKAAQEFASIRQSKCKIDRKEEQKQEQAR